MSFIAGIGKTNVDLLYADMKRIPNVGEEIYADSFSVQLGGGLPGTLVNLARLNVPVRLGTFLGDDLFSDYAKREFEKAHIEVHNFHHGTNLPVNITSAIILKDDRSFISYGELIKITAEDQEAFYQMATGAAICYIENEELADVYRQLKREGTVLVYDTGWNDDMSLQHMEPLLSLADYYAPNQKEAMKLTGTDSPEQAAFQLQAYFKKVIVKADRNGCYGLENGELFLVPPINDFTHVDSTGAGDAFLAGFVYGLFHDYAFKDCIMLGNITGGKAVTANGALSAYCTEEELLLRFNQF